MPEAAIRTAEGRAYTVGEVVRMVNAQANALFANLGTLGLVRAIGVLGPLRDNRYPTFYGVDLRDSSSNEVLSLDIPKALGPHGLVGREVEVGGTLQAKRGLQVALQVTRIRPTAEVNPDVLQEEKSLRDVFQRPTVGNSDFPPADGLKGRLLVSCIHGVNSAVKEDFENQVEGLDLVRFDFVPVNIQEPVSIAEGIRKARGHVVILMRGGGNEGDFEVFNRPATLDAWRAKRRNSTGPGATPRLLVPRVNLFQVLPARPSTHLSPPGQGYFLNGATIPRLVTF